MISIPRLPWDEHFMLHAHLVATRSTCNRGPELLFDPGRHGVGAVIVRKKRIIAGGYNGSAPGAAHCDDIGHEMVEGHCVRTIHSEMNAIAQCAMDGVSPETGVIYCTASPCYDCAKMLLRVGIQGVVFGQAYDSRYGLSPTVKDMLDGHGVAVKQLVLEFRDDGRIRRAV